MIIYVKVLLYLKITNDMDGTVPDPSIDCFNQCEYLPRENNSFR